MKKLLSFMLLCMIISALTGCIQLQPTLAEMTSSGGWEGKTYRNELLHLCISIPEKWVAPSAAQVRESFKQSNDFWTDFDPELEQQLEENQKGGQVLFVASSKPLDKMPDAILIVGLKELTPEKAGSKNAEDDHFRAWKELYDKLPSEIVSLSEVSTVRLGNSEFRHRVTTISFSGYASSMGGDYIKRIGNYLLILQAQYRDDKGKKECEDVLNTLQIH